MREIEEEGKMLGEKEERNDEEKRRKEREEIGGGKEGRGKKENE